MTTIAQALKQKNKLKSEIAQLQKRLTTHNSVMKGNPRPFDLTETDAELVMRVNELIALKHALTVANQPMQEKIYRLAELKSLMAFYQKLPTKAGKMSEGYMNTAHEYEAFFNEADTQAKIKTLETQAEQIQDELEAFNHLTHIK